MGSLLAWIIDDDLVAQYTATYKIQQSNSEFRVICHDSVELALDALKNAVQDKNSVPEIVLLDLSFPNKGGWYFLEELERLGPELFAIKIYIISAFTNSRDRAIAALHPSVKGYFDKPLTAVDFTEVFGKTQNES
ncbi:response regulator [Maribacter sp. PR1]|uniref:Response regulator n=1 Tax=Maribacter cobaltidurans TaxID=1178778 RepID=A0ABU7IVR5_9FLAO|nr:MULTISPECIES: response regulator [Maribacter]MDC6389590.1 response regulator [Maribacter sp. PR1]MEE1976979.1 response regulator [Maribacter cobaltidurans]